jgi:hypothetical protein
VSATPEGSCILPLTCYRFLAGPSLFDLDDARAGYYRDLFPLNPGGIVPAGPTPSDLGWPDAPAPVRDESAFAWREV